jgi:hypothetical protein
MLGYYEIFNNYYIKDAGLAFLSPGILWVLSLFRERERLIYSFCDSVFIVLHGLFHIRMLFSGMVPSDYVAYELIPVIVPVCILLVLVALIYAW